MNIRLIDRAAALALSLLLTAGTLGAIDHLAAREQASAVWASAVCSPRA